jgi:hypothetical protein
VDPGACDGFDAPDPDTFSFSGSIFIGPSGSAGSVDVVELSDTSPSLPAGFSFFVRFDD